MRSMALRFGRGVVRSSFPSRVEDIFGAGHRHFEMHLQFRGTRDRFSIEDDLVVACTRFGLHPVPKTPIGVLMEP